MSETVNHPCGCVTEVHYPESRSTSTWPCKEHGGPDAKPEGVVVEIRRSKRSGCSEEPWPDIPSQESLVEAMEKMGHPPGETRRYRLVPVGGDDDEA